MTSTLPRVVDEMRFSSAKPPLLVMMRRVRVMEMYVPASGAR